MELQALKYLEEAIEEIDDYLPLLERQDLLNQTTTSHCLQHLSKMIADYKKDHMRGLH
tara:strand:- start:813 stop:986 length:174 start_codon:yes stop_codon:yes gene_type:complete